VSALYGGVIARATVTLLCVAALLYACSSATPRPVDQAPAISDYKGWRIRVTPSVFYGSPNLWRARVRVWPREVRPETHPGIDVGFSGTATERTAVEQAASAAARRYIDASLPAHR
jgi:hypothetical protein